MEVTHLKSELHKKIDQLTEDQLKEAYGLMINYLNSQDEDPWSTMGQEEKAAIEKGLSQIREGNTHSHEEVMDEFRRRLHQ